jgi:hypothetical protein
MSRRLLASLSLVLALVLAAGTIALASGGGSSPSPAAVPAAAVTPAGTTTTASQTGMGAGRGAFRHGFGVGRAHGGPMLRMLRRLVLTSAADRLGTTPAKVLTAVKALVQEQFAKTAARAGLTPQETAALKDCHRAFGRRGALMAAGARRTGARARARAACDLTTAKAAIVKLRALPKPDLGALKTELSDALGAKLGLTGAKVLEAARAELEARLGQAVAMGFLTADGRATALACFDAPASCDLKALRRLAPGHHGHRPGARALRGRRQ